MNCPASSLEDSSVDSLVDCPVDGLPNRVDGGCWDCLLDYPADCNVSAERRQAGSVRQKRESIDGTVHGRGVLGCVSTRQEKVSAGRARPRLAKLGEETRATQDADAPPQQERLGLSLIPDCH